MHIYYNLFFSLLISIFILGVFFYNFKYYKIRHRDGYLSLLILFLIITSIVISIMLAFYLTINTILDINHKEGSYVFLGFLVIHIIFFTYLDVFMYNEVMNDYLHINIKLSDIKAKEKIIIDLRKKMQNSNNNKKCKNYLHISKNEFLSIIKSKIRFYNYLLLNSDNENHFYISINQFSLLIRSTLSFYDYLRFTRHSNYSIDNKFEILIINPTSNINNNNAGYDLEKLLTTLELTSIDEIQDEHFKLFDMLHI